MNKTLVLIVVFFYACSEPVLFYNKQYYERITSIAIPDTFQIIESGDNGEFITATTFRANKSSLKQLSVAFNFSPWPTITPSYERPRFLAALYLQATKQNLTSAKHYTYKLGTKKNNWVYIIDLENGLLWVEIQYPGAGGT